MKNYDDLDDDLDDNLLGDDDDLDTFARKGGAKVLGSDEERLSAKYADYLMWRDTGSSHDEALDLASMTEEEFTAAEAADADSDSSGFASLDEVDDLDDLDDEDSFGSSSRGSRRSSFDDDDF